MNRRRFLTASAGAVGLLAGCTGGDSSEPQPTAESTPTPTPAASEETALPEGVYVQPFDSEMAIQGVTDAGPYRVALLYAAPHRFWLVEGDRPRERPIRPADDVHLMATVWDEATGRVVPETGLSVEIREDGESVSEAVIYPMLSQGMGFHYGSNFILAAGGDDPDGTYEVEVTVGGLPIRATGAFEGRFAEPHTATFEFTFGEAERAAVQPESNDDYGEPGAVSPMQMDALPSPLSAAEVPGEPLGAKTTDDAEVVPTVLSERSPVGERYLAVYLRSRYNKFSLTAAGLSARLARDGGRVELDPRRTVDPDVGYHYGAALEEPLSAGDELTVDVVTIPQVARHEGYERAFVEMEPVTFTV